MRPNGWLARVACSVLSAPVSLEGAGGRTLTGTGTRGLGTPDRLPAREGAPPSEERVIVLPAVTKTMQLGDSGDLQ